MINFYFNFVVMPIEQVSIADFGKLVKDKRKEKGITQTALGKTVECTKVYVCKIETGVHLPSRKLIGKICKALDINVTITI